MRKFRLLISLFGIVALSGCSFLDDFFNQTEKKEEKPSGEKDKDDDKGGEEEKEEEKEQSEPVKKIGEFYGGFVVDDEHTGFDFSKSLEPIAKSTTGIGDISIYSFNDFHGAVVESSTEPGLKRLGSFFKEKSQLPNTLILDQGDTWQGSFESNYQYGAIVQDVFNYAGVSLRTAGNHDFDWGLDKLKEVTARKSGDDYIPALAANVYDYKNGVNGDKQQKAYGREYATFVLDNGIKVGIVGVIGESQITSITSQLVDTICFTNHVEKIKEISDYLRVTKACDIVIASTHESSEDMYGRASEITSISPVSNKRYVDLVLGGHAHYRQTFESNGVRFEQWASNGKNHGVVNLKYNFETNELVDEQTEVNSFNYNYMVQHYSTTESTIETMVDNYLAGVEDIANEVLSTNFTGQFDDNSIARVMAEAIHKRVSLTVSPLHFAVTNYAREGFNGTTFKYRDLYKCFPFDNQIILLDVSSSYAINGLPYNFTYKEDESINPSYGNTYKCAVLDYVALHQNENRQYDKFPDASKGYTVFNDTNGAIPTYRDILYSYLKANPNKVFDAANYQSSNTHFVN